MTLATLPGRVDTGLQTTMQTSLFDSGPLECADLTASAFWLDETSWILYEPGWLTGSDRLFEDLRVRTPWRATERPMYDRVVRVPRLIATLERNDEASSNLLETVYQGVSRVLGEKFSSVGLNYYRTGSDSVAWHRDRLGQRGRPTVVALVSVGSPRTLAVRPYRKSTAKTAETSQTTATTRATGSRRWKLGHGDLLVMGGACQQRWEHAVPKERGTGARISLAFRARSSRKGPRLQ